MATYTKGEETKRQLVECVYTMLCESNASSITARVVAQAQGCSAAALYRHFDSLEELISVASVRFLHPYMEDYSALIDSDQPFLEIYLKGWELFNSYAFDRPDVYYRLFWGEENHNLGDAVQEYYQLFPFEASLKSAAYFYTLMFDENMVERDFLMLHRASNMGLMTEADAHYFSYTNVLITRGMLYDAMTADEAKRGQLRDKCSFLIRTNTSRVLREGDACTK